MLDNIGIIATLLSGVLISLLASGLFSLVQELLEGRDIRLGPFTFTFGERVRQETTNDRVKRLTEALTESVRLIDELEKEISRRQETATRLEQQIQTDQQVAKLSREQAHAVRAMVEATLTRESRRSFWQGFAMNFVFFLLGAGVSMLVS